MVKINGVSTLIHHNLPIVIRSFTDSFDASGGSMVDEGNILESSLKLLSFSMSISASFLSSLISSGLEGSTSSFSREFSLVTSSGLELEVWSIFSSSLLSVMIGAVVCSVVLRLLLSSLVSC